MKRLLVFLCAIVLSFGMVRTAGAIIYDFESGAMAPFSGAGIVEATEGYSAYGFESKYLRNSSTGNRPSDAIGTISPAASTTLTLTGLAAHDSIDLNFFLAMIESWDGSITSGAVRGAPDYFNVSIDGSSIFQQTFDNFDSTDQSYSPSAGVQLTNPIVDILGSTSWPDAAYNMGLDPQFDNIAHTSNTLTVSWWASGNGWQGTYDESFAIDNVEIKLNNLNPPPIPEPTTMLLFGTGLIGLAGFRRNLKKN